MISALSVLIPILTGFCSIYLIANSAKPQASANNFNWPLTIAIGGPTGLALLSILWFIWLVLGGDKLPIGFMSLEISLTLILTAMSLRAFFAVRRQTNSPPSLKQPAERLPVLTLLFACSAIVSLVRWLAFTYQNPQGCWDAWMIWNVRAAFLARSGSDWLAAFDRQISPWTHLDYPLLLPAMVASGWQLLGHETIAVPITIAFVFSIGTLALLILAVNRLRGQAQALLSGLLLLSVSTYCTWGAAQEADLPLAFFFLLACASLLFCSQVAGVEIRTFLIAALACGLAAWLKNEGLVFALVFSSCTFASYFKQHLLKWRIACSYLAVIAPFIILVACFKIFVAPPGDYLAQAPSIVLAKLLMESRYYTVAGAFVSECLSPAWPLLPMIAYGLYVGPAGQPWRQPSLRCLALTLLFMLLGYFLAYVLSPYEIYNHLRDSLNRLILQLYPAAILLYCCSIATPEEINARLLTQDEQAA